MEVLFIHQGVGMMPGGQVPLAGRNAAVVEGQDAKDKCDFDNVRENHDFLDDKIAVVMVTTNIKILDHDVNKLLPGQQGFRGSMHELNRNFLRLVSLQITEIWPELSYILFNDPLTQANIANREREVDEVKEVKSVKPFQRIEKFNKKVLVYDDHHSSDVEKLVRMKR